MGKSSTFTIFIPEDTHPPNRQVANAMRKLAKQLDMPIKEIHPDKDPSLAYLHNIKTLPSVLLNDKLIFEASDLAHCDVTDEQNLLNYLRQKIFEALD
ncbi:MAG: hypothetical protein JSV04_01555 [Candidatus Heimdallarchaeota archaeon]|nr:MAG: hypothetical protein JSV04_01555 [Candidatus Heimdallarchaeota archaeon]